MIIREILIAVLAGLCFVPAPVPALMRAAVAFTVFDPSNYAENVLQAARALQQINNQIQSLQNQTIMLQNQAKNLQRLDSSSLNEMLGALQRIDGLMNQAQGIAFQVSATQTAYERAYPQQYADAVRQDALVADARLRWQNSMHAYRDTLSVQAQVAENVEADSATLAGLVTASQGAAGNLEVQQAGNQLLALSIKQQLQIQNLLAAQFRAEALEQARAAEAQEQARASFNRFLGDRFRYSSR